MTTSAQMLNGPAHTLSTQLLSDLRDLKGLTAEWSDLCARCPDATPFQRPEWLLPWIEVFSPRDCFTITVRDGRRLIGLALLLIYQRDGKSILAFAGGGHSDYLGLLCDRGREAEVVESVLAFVTTERQWDLLELTDLPADSPILELPVFQGQIREHDSVSGLPLPPANEQLLRIFSKRQRSNLRNAASRLRRAGGGCVESVTIGTLKEFLDDMFRLHTTRWAQSGQPGVLREENTRAFHQRCAPALLQHGLLRIHRLRLGVQTIAVVYSLRDRGTVFCYVQGFDPAHSSLSPGTQLMFAVIEEAQRQGFRWFDFLRGQEAYKQHWRALPQPTFRITRNKTPLRDQ